MLFDFGVRNHEGAPLVRNSWAMTTASRQWVARGGPILLGKIIPGGFVCIGLASLAGSVANIIISGWPSAPGSAFLVLMALLAAYFAWRFFRTTWLVSLTDGTFTWIATTRRWSVGPGEIIAVHGDASEQIIQIVTTHRKIFVWAQLDDRKALFQAIERANPSVRFASSIETT